MPFNVGRLDKLSLIGDLVFFFFDIGSDIYSQVIFFGHGQYRYAGMNIAGIVFGTFGRSLIALAGPGGMRLCSPGFCLERFVTFLSGFLGVDMLFEFIEVWQRGYRTERWTQAKFCESGIEGIVSMGVQLYAFVYEDGLTYESYELYIIGVSICSSILGYALNVGVEFWELSRGRKLRSPEDRNQFSSQFSYEVYQITALRFLEVASRLCLSVYFCYVFRPFGVVPFIASEILIIVAIYKLVMGPIVFGVGIGLFNSILPLSWLSLPEPFLAPPTYMEGKGPRLIKCLNIHKLISTIVMVVLIATLSEDMPPVAFHRRCVLGVGAVAFILLVPLMCFTIARTVGSPELVQRELEGRSIASEREYIKKPAGSCCALLCCKARAEQMSSTFVS